MNGTVRLGKAFFITQGERQVQTWVVQGNIENSMAYMLDQLRQNVIGERFEVDPVWHWDEGRCYTYIRTDPGVYRVEMRAIEIVKV